MITPEEAIIINKSVAILTAKKRSFHFISTILIADNDKQPSDNWN